MKILILTFLLFFPDPIEINRINKTKKEASAAYISGNYEVAAAKYKMLTDSMQIEDDDLYLNLAHSYYHLNDSAKATGTYNMLTGSSDRDIKSIAYQQLGVMAKNNQKLEEAESLLKSAIRSNPANVDARYDYEIVKKLLQQQNDQQQQNQDNQNQDQNDQNQDQDQQQDQQDQQNQEQENQEQESDQDNQEQKQDEQQQQEGEQGDQQEDPQQSEGEQNDQQENQQPGTREKLEEMNISEEKARMILEAMKNNEFQYIQQRKRKPTQKPDPNAPDW